MAFIFHNTIWDVILPIDELIFFKMVKTTNQVAILVLGAVRKKKKTAMMLPQAVLSGGFR
jgi:hypothetical protein